eukprot:905989-Heterocapsa_arctica.AAC.1
MECAWCGSCSYNYLLPQGETTTAASTDLFLQQGVLSASVTDKPTARSVARHPPSHLSGGDRIVLLLRFVIGMRNPAEWTPLTVLTHCPETWQSRLLSRITSEL